MDQFKPGCWSTWNLLKWNKILCVCGFAFNGKSRCDNDQSKWHSTNSKVGAVIWKGMWVSGYQLEIDSDRFPGFPGPCPASCCCYIYPAAKHLGKRSGRLHPLLFCWLEIVRQTGGIGERGMLLLLLLLHYCGQMQGNHQQFCSLLV